MKRHILRASDFLVTQAEVIYRPLTMKMRDAVGSAVGSRRHTSLKNALSDFSQSLGQRGLKKKEKKDDQ